MKRGITLVLAAIAGAVLIAAYSSVFTVHQAAQALVLEFGKPKRVIDDPGLYFKIPIAQEVLYFDKRVLEFDVPAEEVIASDQKRLVVDSFARYVIVDPLKFFQAVGNEAVIRTRLASIINASVRRALGNVPLNHIISGERAALMNQIQDIVNREATGFGIDVVDVRIKRADLPEKNSQAIYGQMRTAREREAKEIRAKGEQRSSEIRAEADRDRVVIIANANKDSQILRGEGDAEAIRIFADAFGQDIEFFAFYRSMEAYRAALGSGDTTMILSPDSEFFRFFRNMEGVVGTPAKE